MNGILNVKLKIVGDTTPPAYGTDGAGCFDIAVPRDQTALKVEAGSFETFRTGLYFEIPEGWMMLVGSRSGMGFRHRVRLSNCLGFIDSDYRGELCVQLMNDGTKDIIVDPGDRIAQAFMVQPPRVNFLVVDELGETERGENGLGSTGGFAKA